MPYKEWETVSGSGATTLKPPVANVVSGVPSALNRATTTELGPVLELSVMRHRADHHDLSVRLDDHVVGPFVRHRRRAVDVQSHVAAASAEAGVQRSVGVEPRDEHVIGPVDARAPTRDDDFPIRLPGDTRADRMGDPRRKETVISSAVKRRIERAVGGVPRYDQSGRRNAHSHHLVVRLDDEVAEAGTGHSERGEKVSGRLAMTDLAESSTATVESTAGCETGHLRRTCEGGVTLHINPRHDDLAGGLQADGLRGVVSHRTHVETGPPATAEAAVERAAGVEAGHGK